jgi:hypothetical protein
MGKSKLGGRRWRQGGLRLWRVPPSDAVAAEGHLENDIAVQIDEVQVVASLVADGMEDVCSLRSK